jgi:hypothetical protein
MSRPIAANTLIRFHVGRDHSRQILAALKGKGMVRRNAALELVADLRFERDKGKPPRAGEPE